MRQTTQHLRDTALHLPLVPRQTGPQWGLQADLQTGPQMGKPKGLLDVTRLNALLGAGNHKQADREAAKLLRQAPDNLSLMLVRGQAALLTGRAKHAAAWADKALAKDPQCEAAVLLQARSAIPKAGLAGAVKGLETYLTRFESVTIRQHLAQYLMQAAAPAKALGVLQGGLSATDADARSLELIGLCFQRLSRIDEAKAAFDLGMQVDPGYAANYRHRADIAQNHDKEDPRIYHLKALQADPQNNHALVQFLWYSLARCDWAAYDQLIPKPDDIAKLTKGHQTASPWFFLPFADDPEASLAHQRSRQESRLQALGEPAPKCPQARAKPEGERIRIGYYSNDFYDHATLLLFSGVLRHHDRTRFELHCFDFGPEASVGAAHSHFFEATHDIRAKSDRDVTDLSRRMGIDIAVDLKGDTHGSRNELFLLGQAPVQINFLGYPGTMGSKSYDYIIADQVLIPPQLEHCYDEKVIRLPSCYLPVDDRQRSGLPPTRTALGLPENAVVLACHNAPYKISQELFAIWLEALARVPDAVLWLLEQNEDCQDNLLTAAAKAGIAPERFVFSRRAEHQAHISRLAQADLYLDTFHVNAHTLAADAICAAHVPVLTRIGRQFAARVGASFVTAAGLPELVAHSSSDYLEKLVALASAPQDLLRLRGQIAKNRTHLPLFSSSKYTAALEEAYQTAFEIAQSGAPARSFDISPQPAMSPTIGDQI